MKRELDEIMLAIITLSISIIAVSTCVAVLYATITGK